MEFSGPPKRRYSPEEIQKAISISGKNALTAEQIQAALNPKTPNPAAGPHTVKSEGQMAQEAKNKGSVGKGSKI